VEQKKLCLYTGISFPIRLKNFKINFFLALSVLRSFEQDMMDAKYFAIIIDETTDASCTEQVRICIRYVTQNLKVQETFKGFMKPQQRMLVPCLKLPKMLSLD